MEANKNKEAMVPFNELERQAREIGIEGFSINDIDRQLIIGDKPRSISQRLVDFITDNRQRILTGNASGFAVIPVHGWEYPAGAIRGKKHIIVIDWYNRMGCIRTKDTEEYAKLLRRYKADVKQYKRCEKQLAEAYSKSRSIVTSDEFWKRYLGI